MVTTVTPDFTSLDNGPSLPVFTYGSKEYWQRIAQNWMRQANQGKLACVGKITLANNDNKTTVNDSRAGPKSTIRFMPLTAHAALELRYLIVVAQGSGTFSIEHRVLTYTDHTYRYAILG